MTSWSPWRPRTDSASSPVAVRRRPAVVASIKAFHTLAWLSIESCVAYVLWAGFTGRSDRRAGVAAAVVAGETLVFASNGCRCPLTQIAERYGAEHGSVTDIYLPTWFAHNLPAIHAPLLVLMAYLHARNLMHPGAAAAHSRRAGRGIFLRETAGSRSGDRRGAAGCRWRAGAIPPAS